MKSKFHLVDYIVIATLAAVLLPVVANKLPFGLHSFRFFWGPLSVLSIILTRPKVLFYGPLKYVFLLGVIVFGMAQGVFWPYLGEWERGLYISEFISITVATTIWSYYFLGREYNKLAKISLWAFLFILITLIATNVALFYDPLVVRQAANTQKFTTLQLRLYNLYGTMSYGYAQSVVFLIPLFVYYIKTRQKLLFLVPFLVVMLLFLIFSLARFQVFANFMVAVVILAASLLGIKNQRSVFRVLLLGSILLIFAPSDMPSRAVFGIRNYFKPESDIYIKLTDAIMVLEAGDIEAGRSFQHRSDRYPLLFDALKENPIKGYASHKRTDHIFPGFHIWWMYRLALWGIPGFLLFVYVLYKLFRSVSCVFIKKKANYYYILCLLSFVLLGLTKNIAGHQPWFMLIVVIPGLFLVSELNDKNSLSQNIAKSKMS